MKRLSLIGKVAVSVSLVVCLMACQKQQEATTDATTDATIVNNTMGTDYSGKISRDDAQELADTFKKLMSDNNQTQYVAFNIKDLQKYLATLTNKYKADVVYVNFGVYNKNTTTDPSKIGRTTVFFSGNNTKKTGLSGIKTGNDLDELDFSDYLNHGQVYP
jgi:hypothetical protein